MFALILLAGLLVAVVLASTLGLRSDQEAAPDGGNVSHMSDKGGASAGGHRSASTPPSAGTSSITDSRTDLGRARFGDPDPTGPPAAIYMEVTGTHPWAPTRVFVSELKDEGYETTVELPDLVILRDGNRQPVTLREPAGPPGQLIITTTPELTAEALEILVRSLLADSFTVDATNGRDIHLTDDAGVEVRLSVTELALA